MKRVLFAIALASGLAPYGAFAAVTATEWEQLRAEFSALAQRVQVLETENAKLKELVGQGSPVLVAEPKQPGSVGVNNGAPEHWSDRISIAGDFRYRYEEIYVEGVDTRDLQQ